jgi:primosomal protein N' (replication factor Y)
VPDRVVRVLPDVPAIDRSFDYLVPDSFGDQVRVGTMVRVLLSGRRVAGWVLDADVLPEPGMRLAELSKVVGVGPPEEVVELCRWAAWRWAGRLATVLRLASPDRAVPHVPPVRERRATRVPERATGAAALAMGPGVHVVEVAPTTDPLEVVLGAAALGQVIVVAPQREVVDRLARGVRGAGAAVARWPRDWAAAAGGATVIGGRAAVFAPAPLLRAVVVVDEHDEMLQSESSPTWHAHEVAIERARRAGVPCLLVSPCPSLEALAAQRTDGGAGLWTRPGPGAPAAPIVDLPAAAERVSTGARRSGWAPLTVIDRRGEDSGRSGLYSSRLVEAVREVARDGGRVVCVLNRTGRARLLACRSCGSVAECEVCGTAVHSDDRGRLVCASCATMRPAVCMECGSTALATLKLGVTRAREELEALAREPVVAVTAAGSPTSSGSSGSAASSGSPVGGPEDEPHDGAARILIGTEAVLHRVGAADLVAFLDLDQELLAPRYRAAEEALALIVLANRLVGGRSRGGRVVVQTRTPEHEVIQAALRADPRPVAEAEAARRRLLRFPPAATVVVVGREAAEAYVERVGNPVGISVLGPDDGRWVVRSEDRDLLLDHLSSIERPPGQLRLQVDPARIR